MNTNTEVNPERILVDINQDSVKALRENYFTLYRLTTPAVESFSKIGIGPIESISEIQEALKVGADEYVNRRIESFVGPEQLKLGGLSIKRSKLSETFDVGSPVPFQNAIAALEKHLISGYTFKYLTIQDGKILMNEELMEQDIVEKSSTFISSPIAIAVYQKAQKLQEAIIDFNSIMDQVNGDYQIKFNGQNFNRFFYDPSHSFDKKPLELKKEWAKQLAHLT